jgi:hypothetical protein
MGAYFGFSEKMDEHIGSFTVRVQKPYTYCNKSSTSKPTLQTEVKPMVSQNSEQDKTDMLMLDQPNTIIYSTERNQCKSSMLVQMVNKFGQEDGFNRILDCINLE